MTVCTQERLFTAGLGVSLTATGSPQVKPTQNSCSAPQTANISGWPCQNLGILRCFLDWIKAIPSLLWAGLIEALIRRGCWMNMSHPCQQAPREEPATHGQRQPDWLSRSSPNRRERQI